MTLDNPFAELPRTTLLRAPTVAKLLGGVHEQTVKRRSRTGALPAGLRITSRQTVWPAGALRDWYDAMAAAQ